MKASLLMVAIRLLQLAKHFDPDTGGIETVTLNISEMLGVHDIRADVLCTEVAGPYAERERPYRVIRCKSDMAFGNKRLSLDYVRQVRRLASEYDCALIHLPNPVAVAAALAFWRKPVILLWHADIPQVPIRVATAPLDRALIRQAKVVLGPTPIHLARSHQADAIAGKDVVIAYPFDRGNVPQATGTTEFARRLEAFRGPRKLSISIGRLVPYKGFDVLIDAARDFGDELAAVIVGTGPEQENLFRRITAAGVGDRVMLAGSLSAAELGDALALAHIGCMPSVTAAEMYGMAQVECMTAGLPMVSTNLDRSGVSYVNRDGETGLIVPPGDAKALAQAMLQLVRDPVLRQRLAEGARRSVEVDHDIGPVSRRYADLIRGVVAGRVGAAALAPVR